ncbi:MAG: DegV family protein [Anaerolineaceae bacterium]|nr:DegV family protein [Anaerolineaceae bacterium]
MNEQCVIINAVVFVEIGLRRKVLMPKVAIVTDSGAYIPPELYRDYPVYIVPFQLVWGDRTFLDGVDIQLEDFYSRLETSEIFPSTSQPPPSTFMDLYNELLQQGYEVLSIQTSSKLSGTYSSAVQASKMLAGAPIEVVDSKTTAMEMGFHVLAAARAAANGAALLECKAIAEKARSHTGVYFVVSTLDFLHRGGRIGGAAAFVGNALQLKPILHVQNGRVEAVDRVRTMQKAVERMVQIVGKRISKSSHVRIAALYANEPQRAANLLEQTMQAYDPKTIIEAFCAGVSPVVGTHTGPAGVGLAFMADM